MKTRLLLLTCVLWSAAYGQLFSEDFETVTTPSLPAGWTSVSFALDSGFRTTNNYTSSYFDFPAHTTYVGTNDDFCNCNKSNELLISPIIVMPATGNYGLSFEYVLGNYSGEYAEVRVSTDGGATSTLLQTLSNTSISIATNGDCEWRSKEVDLSAYLGQTINLVWKYHDNYNWASGFMLDDVLVQELPLVDMAMVTITSDTLCLPGAFNVEGVIKSLGGNMISSVDIVWNDGTGNQSYTMPVSLNFGDTASFTHPTPVLLAGGQVKSVDVWVVMAGDTLQMNDTLTKEFRAVSSFVQKRVVGELRNGEWCGWNPRGDVSMAQTTLDHPTNFIGISIHNGDNFTVPSYDSGISAYLPSSFPTCAVDRIYSHGSSGFASGLIENEFPLRENHVPPAGISVLAAEAGSIITVEITANMVVDLSGDYRLAAVLVHDSLIGSHQNYYAGGSYGPLTMPNYGSMANYEFHTAPSFINPYYHDFTAVALGNDEINGDAGSIPTNLVDGNAYSYTYTFNIDSSWTTNRMRAIGMLINAATGEILNADQSHISALSISENNLSSSMLLSPNPSNGNFAISLDLKYAQDMTILVLNASGEQVYADRVSANQAGIFDYGINIQNHPTGLYVVQVITEEGVAVKKVNVVR